jgi:hypothetical protein
LPLLDFVIGLGLELRLRAVPFDRGELETFATDVWPLAEDDSDVLRWAEAFLAARQEAAAASCPRTADLSSQGGPLAVHALPLNPPDHALADPEALADQPAGLGHVQLVVLEIHQRQENLLAAVLRKGFVALVVRHGIPSFW